MIKTWKTQAQGNILIEQKGNRKSQQSFSNQELEPGLLGSGTGYS